MRWLLLLLLAAPGPAVAAQESAPAPVRGFLEKHCLSCHGPRSAKAGLRVDRLPDFGDPRAADEWKEVLDKINLGEMPPKEKPRPAAREFEPVVAWIQARLRDAELAAKNAGGRILMRRLNRTEFANTIRDLLHLDPNELAPLVEDLPYDGKAEGFDRLGVALLFDGTQIERTMAAVERIAARAIVEGEPALKTQRYDPEKDKATRESAEQKTVRSRFSNRQIEAGPSGARLDRDGVTFIHGNGSNDSPWGRVAQVGADAVVGEDGYYRIRARAGADPGSRGTPILLHLLYAPGTPVQLEAELRVDAPLAAPAEVEKVVFLRRGPPDQKRRLSVSFNHVRDLIVTAPESNAFFREINGGAQAYQKALAAGAPKAELDAMLAKIEEAKARERAWQGPASRFNPERDAKHPPALHLDWIEITGPVRPEWPPKSHRSLLFDGDRRADAGYIREIFSRFLPRAYRRPVSTREIDAVVATVEGALSRGAGFPEAIRRGLVRALCSPGFLFLQEPSGDAPLPRRLNAWELASRLSYFLWSSMPDPRLFDLAASGRLAEPAALLGEVDRMLDDPKAAAFVRGFAGQWLHVRDYGSVMPAREYRDYDAALEEASKEEAYAFFHEILARDLPVTNFLDSDFLVINERLAVHYGIPDVKGPEFRRVAIRPEHHRGGVLGMAGLLTLLADGTRTLPVRRAAWVLTELFDDPPGNPPPDAGEIQPNAAGQNLTVRDRLDRHRNEPTCASCHTKLDPFGIALENYDAIGKWRTKANGEGFRGRNVPAIDASGAFADGTRFANLEEYKAGLLRRQDAFVRALGKKLLTYALTRPVRFTDHRVLEDVASAALRDGRRLRSLIRAVVASDLFRTK